MEISKSALYDKRYFYILLVFAIIQPLLILIFPNDIGIYDDYRNAINAIEMFRNGDFINLYFNGEPETWNCKPPFLMWATVLSLKIFGCSLSALKLPSVLSGFFIIIIFWKIVTLYRPPAIAFLACMILLSTRSIFGNHIAKSIDFDGIRIMFELLAVLGFLQFTDFNKTIGIYLSGFSLGLAFLTKGPAMFILLPALVIYYLWRKGIQSVFNIHIILSAIVFVAFIFSWWLAIKEWGIDFTKLNPIYANSKNAWDVLINNDVIDRATSSNFGSGHKHFGFSIYFNATDIYINVWNYVLYFVLIIFAFSRYKSFSFFNFINRHPFVFFSFIVLSSIVIAVSLMKNQHQWYIATVFPFFAYLCAEACFWLTKQEKRFAYVCLALLIFTYSRQVFELYIDGKKTPAFWSNNIEQAVKNADAVYYNQLEGNYHSLLLKLYNQHVYYQNTDSVKMDSNTIYITGIEKQKVLNNKAKVYTLNNTKYIINY